SLTSVRNKGRARGLQTQSHLQPPPPSQPGGFCPHAQVSRLPCSSLCEEKDSGYSVHPVTSDRLGNKPAYLSPRDPQSPLCKATEYCLRPSVCFPRGSSDCMQQKLCGISTTNPPLSVLLEDPRSSSLLRFARQLTGGVPLERLQVTLRVQLIPLPVSP
ncbi:hypothetical protein CPAR01_01806, partial [Colletotrichum paranaense]